jgi:hypothetical protein
MAALDLLSTLVLALGWGGATLWSGRSALRATGSRQMIHGGNVVLMLLAGFAILTTRPGLGMIAGVVLMLTSLLVARTDRTDPYRWLLMIQFVFALLIASGAPFRGAA